MPWLNDVERGEQYKPGDLYGSLGAWFAGRWHTPGANEYIARVKDTLKRPGPGARAISRFVSAYSLVPTVSAYTGAFGRRPVWQGR